jgi:hypothetical protein
MTTFYTVSGIPAAQTRASSSQMRAEFVLVQTAFASVNTDITANLAANVASIATKGAITGQAWTGTHNFTGGTITVPTLAYGTTGSYAVSMDTLNAAVFAAANLPAQTGNSGKVLTTNGTTPSWALAYPVQTGNAGKFLTTDGTNPSWDVPTIPGMKLLATLTPTAAANVDFLSTFSASYDNYLIIGTGLLPATSDNLTMRFANAGAVDTAANYAPLTMGTSTQTTTASSMVIVPNIYPSGKGGNFSILIENANDATNGKGVTGSGSGQDGVTPSWNHYSVNCFYFKTAAVSGVRFYWASGANFVAGGKIRVYGYSNT